MDNIRKARVKKPPSLRTGTTYRGRDLTLTLYPRHIEFHEFGRKESYELDIDAAFDLAMKLNQRKQKKQPNSESE